MLSLDFSKAFDTIRHSTLLTKLSSLSLPDNIYNWMVAYFDGRAHCTKFAGKTSKTANISASCIQGSAVGPVSFIVQASDLQPSNPENRMVKFADDMNILVGSNNINTITKEMDHVSSWAEANNLKLNNNKTAEIVFARRGCKATPPPTTPGVTRVTSLKLLGVTLQSNLQFDKHISNVVSACSSSFFALRILRSHGLPPKAIHEVCRATTLSRLMYASPAWWGYLNNEGIDRLESFVRKAKRMGYLPQDARKASELGKSADDALFKAVCTKDGHVLHRMLPPVVSHKHNLRNRAHPYTLPSRDNNFISRMLFKNIY